MALRIELLDGRHCREDFDCGVAALDGFLWHLAGQQQRRGFGKTYVALADNGTDVVGYVTVAVGQVEARVLPTQRKLPRQPVPMLRIGRLAVDKRMQGQGIGLDLLAFALQLAIEFSARVGLYAVVVDAKDDRAAEFYRRLHFEPTLDNPLCLFLPLSRLAGARAGQ